MAGRERTPEEARVIAFYEAMRALSDDPEMAARIIITIPDSHLVLSCSLSVGDLEAATEALAAWATVKKAMAALTPDESELSEADLPEVDGEEVAEIMSGFEALLRDEGGQTA